MKKVIGYWILKTIIQRPFNSITLTQKFSLFLTTLWPTKILIYRYKESPHILFYGFLSLRQSLGNSYMRYKGGKCNFCSSKQFKAKRKCCYQEYVCQFVKKVSETADLRIWWHFYSLGSKVIFWSFKWGRKLSIGVVKKISIILILTVF